MEQVALWTAVAISGFGLAIVSGRWAVRHATMLASGLDIPPFIIAITLVAIGTDIPEILNSVIASVAGHGDLNVGDSIGSVVCQVSLVLGLLPFAGGSFEVGPSRSSTVILLTIVALALGAVLVSDGELSRIDAIGLITAWLAATAISWRFAPPRAEPVMIERARRGFYHGALLLAALLLVGAGAGAAVKAMVELSALIGVPEYLIAFFGSSIGTSMPELIVDITALRRGQRDLAFGDVVGSCLVDSTLSVGIGPLIVPTAVTAALAVRGAGVAMAAMLLAGLIIWIRGRHDRWSGAFLIALYLAAYAVLL